MNHDFPTRRLPSGMPKFPEIDEEGYFSFEMPEYNPEKISAPCCYSGYTRPKYNGARRHSEYLMVRDGTKIAIDYLIPTLNRVEVLEPLPVVWEFTPYGRIMKRNGKLLLLKGSERDTLLLSHGYILATAELRGTGASFGRRPVTNSAYDMTDGHDVNEWIAKQPWCNGKIGMLGGSYTGQTILSTMAGKPKHLLCAFITCTDYNKYDGWVRGSISRCFGGDPNRDPDIPIEVQLQTAVPVDDDPDGSLMREAVMQHKENGSQLYPFKYLNYRDDWSDESDGELWNQISASTKKDDINASGAAVYLHGGWYDVFRRDTFIMYANMTLPKKMIVGPWYHCGSDGINMAAEYLRFYDYWLKDIENGLMDEAPIYMYTQYGEWKLYSCWPLPEEERISLFLSGGKLESMPMLSEEKDIYTADYTIEAGVESTGTKELDEKALVYDTVPLSQDLQVTGHSLASLWISSDAPDIDVFVTLTDVASDGETFLVSDGRLRASRRKTDQPPYDFLDLPWHRSNKSDEHFLKPGLPVRLDIDLQPISYIFRKGHKIRLEITNALRGFFFLQQDPPAVMTLYRDPIHSSYISLPVIREENHE